MDALEKGFELLVGQLLRTVDDARYGHETCGDQAPADRLEPLEDVGALLALIRVTALVAAQNALDNPKHNPLEMADMFRRYFLEDLGEYSRVSRKAELN